jgi:hypothetical protein
VPAGRLGETMKRVLVTATFLVVFAWPAAAPSAVAKTPSGSCPPTFEGPLAISALPAELQEFATFLDTQVGGNGDGKICVDDIAVGTPGGGLNILDNRVAGF